MCHPPPPLLLLLRCSRKSKLVKHDQDSFIDLWNDEITNAEEGINDSVTWRDGMWLFDMGWDPAERNFSEKHPADTPTAGLDCSYYSAGTVRVYSNLAAANAAAALVWESLQVNHGFDGLAPDVLTTSSSSEYEDESEDDSEDQDEEDEEEEDQPEFGDPDVDPRFDLEREPVEHNAAQPERPQQQEQGDLGGLKRSNSSGSSSAEFCTVRSDGRCSWSRTRQYYADPWCDKGSEPRLHNRVSSTCTVEVMKAQLE
jgi:hypothetical protein